MDHDAAPVGRRRLQLILEELEQLPTLSPIAARLLELTSSDESEAREVAELVGSDPALASRVLRLCRASNRMLAGKDLSIERAIVQLGFDEVRTAALSVEVFELLRGVTSRGGETHGPDAIFDLRMFWRHAIAVATAASRIAAESPRCRGTGTGEAFIAGLLHDLGQLTLYTLMPRSVDRACALAESHGVSIERACRSLIGADPQTIGRRLALHWRLPAPLVDVIWLNGRPLEALPPSVDRTLITVVTAADLVARHQMLAHAGHGPAEECVDRHRLALEVSQDAMRSISDQLHVEVAQRAAGLGLDEANDVTVLRESIDRANAIVTAVRTSQRRHAAASRLRSRTLHVCRLFHENAPPSSSVASTARAVAISAAELSGSSPLAVICIDSVRRQGALFLFGGEADLQAMDVFVIPPDFAPADPRSTVEGAVARMLPWFDLSILPGEFRTASALRLECGPESQCYVVRPGGFLASTDQAGRGLFRMIWGAGLAAAMHAERVGQVSAELAEVNRDLHEDGHAAARTRAFDATMELAAGAAHEMNNPLTVICGRAQLLTSQTDDPRIESAGHEIARQANRLSDLITAMLLFARPPEPQPTLLDLQDLTSEALRELGVRAVEPACVRVRIDDDLPPIRADLAQLATALRELLQNAHEAAPREEIQLNVQSSPLDGRLRITVVDRGPGLSKHALVHAFDPFFSEKAAGRQPGLGLARARRLVELNGGTLSLKNRPDGGAVATISLEPWADEARDEGDSRKGLREPASKDPHRDFGERFGSSFRGREVA